MFLAIHTYSLSTVQAITVESSSVEGGGIEWKTIHVYEEFLFCSMKNSQAEKKKTRIKCMQKLSRGSL